MKDFVIQGYSGSLHWGNYLDDVEVVNIGDGRDDSDYEGIGGKAVIVRFAGGGASGAPANAELFFKAWEYGAAAIILHNMAYGAENNYVPIFISSPLPERWPDTSYPDIPFFMVSNDVGDEICKHLTDHKLRMDFDIPIREVNLNVVVGDIEGRTDELVIMGAHHDTVYNGPGAVDNTDWPAALPNTDQRRRSGCVRSVVRRKVSSARDSISRRIGKNCWRNAR